MKKPRLSIVIATRNRERYCIKCLKVMLNFIDELTEIVISDNSKSNKIDQFISSLNDERLKYSHSTDVLTMSENYNMGLSLASGEYICMIGDDDIILPSIYQTIIYAKEKNIDCVTQAKVINYIWPLDQSNGILYLPKFSNLYNEVKTKNNLEEYFREGCSVNPRDYSLPSLYHGIVKKSILEDVKKRRGAYIDGISPDSYIAVVLSQFIKTQIEVDYPFSIGGACHNSATISNVKGKHSGSLDSSEQYVLNVSKGYQWHSLVPKYYSVQSIWADSALHAVDSCVLLDLFNLTNLTARAIAENRKMIFDIYSSTKSYIIVNKMFFYFRLLAKVVKLLSRKVVARLKVSQASQVLKIENVGEIDNVLNFL